MPEPASFPLAPASPGRRRRWLATAVAVAAGCGLIAYPAVVGAEFSAQLVRPAPFAYPDEPARYGLKPEPVAIKSSRVAGPLSGWLFEPPGGSDRAVLFLHGWRSHKHHMLGDYLSWLARRYTVLAFDHPGHGDSPPGDVTLGLTEREDAASALALLQQRGYTRLGVFGVSMGGTTAIGLAAEHPEVRAVVSEATFARLADVPLGYLRSHGYWFPELLAETTIALAGLRTGRALAQADAVRHIGRIAPRPVLLVHGTQDHVIGLDNGERLYAAAGEPKAFWKVPGADHVSEHDNGPHDAAPAAYERRVTEFFDRWL